MGNDDFIRKHIETAGGRDGREARSVIVRIAGVCWPGGTADRTEPGARAWLRLWRPATAGTPLPVCSCAAGRCAVCN